MAVAAEADVTAYYNEIDPYAASWLENLISAGHIAGGDVDRRSIVDVRADDLRGYTQCHFFAGIGGWSCALRLAGWPDDQPVWTGSCPCQPLSCAGLGKGHADERHLWPAFHGLISECRPAMVFGEQVASKDGREWMSAVRSDLEALGYACGAADLCAAGAGAPHIRQRLFWMAHADYGKQDWGPRNGDGSSAQFGTLGWAGISSELAHPNGRDASTEGLQRSGQHGQQQDGGRAVHVADTLPAGRAEGWSITGNGSIAGSSSAFELGNAPGSRCDQQSGESRISLGERIKQQSESNHHGRINPWADLDWLPCTDGKARPTQPGLFPLAPGIPGRVGRLRAYGNAIVPQVAAQFIQAAIG